MAQSKLELSAGSLIITKGSIVEAIPRSLILYTKDSQGKYRIYFAGDVDRENAIVSDVSSNILDENDTAFASDAALDSFLVEVTGVSGIDVTESAISTVACTTSSTEALASGARAGASFVNLATQDAYILLGSGTASDTNYTVRLASGGEAIYETPFAYTGAIQVVFAAAGTGNLVITKI